MDFEIEIMIYFYPCLIVIKIIHMMYIIDHKFKYINLDHLYRVKF